MNKEASEKILVKVYDMGLHSNNEPSVRQATLTWALEELEKRLSSKPPLLSNIQAIVGKYYQDCNASNPPKPYLAMEIAERVAQAQWELCKKWMEGV